MLDCKRRADHSLFCPDEDGSSSSRVVKAGRAAARRFLCGGQQMAGVHTRCSPTRNDGQAGGRAVGRKLRIFSRGAHAASRLWQPGYGLGEQALVDEAGQGVLLPSWITIPKAAKRASSSRATRSFSTASPASPWEQGAKHATPRAGARYLPGVSPREPSLYATLPQCPPLSFARRPGLLLSWRAFGGRNTTPTLFA